MKKHKFYSFVAPLMIALYSSSPIANISSTSSSSDIQVNISQYDPKYDFGSNGYLKVSTNEICSNDFVIEGYGCVTGELELLNAEASTLIPGLSKSQLIALTDNLETNSVYLYVFRTTRNVRFDKVSVSTSTVRNGVDQDTKLPTYNDKFAEYNLTPISISSDGYFIKYKIDMEPQPDGNLFRRYMIRQLYNSDDSTKTDIINFLSGGYNEYLINADNSIVKNKIDLLEITDKQVAFDMTFDNATLFNSSAATQNYFVFFNTAKDEYFEGKDAKIIEAIVNYDYIEYKNIFFEAPQNYYGVGVGTSGVNLDAALEEIGISGAEQALNYDREFISTKHSHDKKEEYTLVKGSLQTDTAHIYPETITVNGDWLSTVSWDSMGKISEKYKENDEEGSNSFNNCFLKKYKDKYKWYVNFLNLNTIVLRDYVTFADGTRNDAMKCDEFVDVENVTITKLAFKYADETIHNFITTDVYTDSSGYVEIFDDSVNIDWGLFAGWSTFTILLIAGIALIVCCILFPQIIPYVIKFLLLGVKLFVLFIQFLVWLVYLILVFPIQAIVQACKKEKVTVWSPFKSKGLLGLF